MLTRSKLSAITLLAAVFVVGLAAGASVVTTLKPGAATALSREEGRSSHDRGRRRGYAERLQEELGLSAEQRAAVDAILAERQAEMHEMWETVRPRYEALRDSVRAQILAVLDDGQQSRYRDLIERGRSRGEKRREGNK